MGVREEEHSIGGDGEKQSTNGDNEIEHTMFRDNCVDHSNLELVVSLHRPYKYTQCAN